MKKRFTTLLIILMTLSLAGIICVQGYWISDALRSNEKHFSFNAKQAMMSVAKEVHEREFIRYFHPLKKAVDSLKKREYKSATSLIENYKVVQEKDSALIYKKKTYREMKNVMDRIAMSLSHDTTHWYKAKIMPDGVEQLSTTAEYEFLLYESLIKQYTNKIPITQRVNTKQIDQLLKKELQKRDIQVAFQFAVYKNNELTPVRSESFYVAQKNMYKTAFFEELEAKNELSLVVNFIGKKEFVYSSVSLMVMLSTLLTLVILATYFYAYKQISTQRQISEIKTDFINNMTHELKTPLATISLALDFIENPLIGNDVEKRKKYLDMVRYENKQINAQVENVLRISQLEKNELQISKKRIKLHDIIHDAVNHVTLLVENKGGYIKMHLEASKSSILANESHFTNVIINILENAIKYTDDTPKVDIYTENVKNSIILRVEDQGIGMSSQSQTKIFEKFFREHTGDLHNVKGHGLGLSYVKQIVEDHQGQIFVESTKGKGTIFIIKLPLIS